MELLHRYLLKLDENELFEAWLRYRSNYLLKDIFSSYLDSFTVDEIKWQYRQAFREFAERLRETIPMDAGMVIIPTIEIKDGKGGVGIRLCRRSEVLRRSIPEEFEPEYTDYCEMLGTPVAETPFVKDDMVEVIAYILHLMSLNGYTQADVERSRREYRHCMKEVPDIPGDEIREVLENMGKLRKVSPEEEEMINDLYLCVEDYNKHMFMECLYETMCYDYPWED